MPQYEMSYPYAIQSADPRVGRAEPGEVREFDENPDPNFWREAGTAPPAPEPAVDPQPDAEDPAPVAEPEEA